MLGMKPRPDMRYKGYYYGVVDYETQETTHAGIEFRYGKRTKKQSSFEVVDNYESVGVSAQYVTDSTIDFEMDGKISHLPVLTTEQMEDAELITDINEEYDKANLTGNKWGVERGKLQVLDVT